MKKKDKEKILDALDGLKEFEVRWMEEVTYSQKVKAKSKEEVEEMFYNGEIVGNENDITDSNLNEYSLEIYEEENDVGI